MIAKTAMTTTAASAGAADHGVAAGRSGGRATAQERQKGPDSALRPPVIVSWILQIVCAAILFQTLFFKFAAAEESVYIFRTLGMEPWGRIGSGVAELAACVLLLIPRTIVFGAVLAVGVISGAVFSHLTRLGIVVLGDHGLLFALALCVWLCGLAVLWIRRRQLLSFFRGRRSA